MTKNGSNGKGLRWIDSLEPLGIETESNIPADRLLGHLECQEIASPLLPDEYPRKGTPYFTMEWQSIQSDSVGALSQRCPSFHEPTQLLIQLPRPNPAYLEVKPVKLTDKIKKPKSWRWRKLNLFKVITEYKISQNELNDRHLGTMIVLKVNSCHT